MRCNFALTASLLMVCGIARADTPAQARKAIEGNYAKIAAALGRRDVDATFAFETPDYVAVSKKGQKLTRDQAHQMMRQITFAQAVKARTSVLAFSLSGNTATAKHRTHIDATIGNPQTNQTGKVTVDAVSSDTWVKTGGRWLLKRSQVLTSSQNMQGMGK